LNVLLGPTLSGKTSLMRLMAGLDVPTSGSVWFDGKDVTGIPVQKRNVAMVYQQFINYPAMTVYENIASPLRVAGTERAKIDKEVRSAAALLKLTPYLDRTPLSLSGGQQQRTALARAIVKNASLVLLDEPLAALDLKIRQHMLAEMKRIHAESGTTFVYVTHDQDEAMILSDRVALMEKGRIVQLDRPEDMYARPKSLFAAKFLGETNLFEARVTHVNGVGTTAVTPSGIRFLASDANASQDDSVTISIRPESLSFQSGDAAPQSVEGTVEDIVFIGSRSFYTVRLDDQSSVRIQVQRNARNVPPALHARTKVFWDAANVVML
ncbi:MAG: ABC transporter ATP-binding protein, partial [Mesorhizobium sp.]